MRICIVGAGPRGTGVLQRLCALSSGLEVHVVDPYPPGPGRIWRRAQPDLLWMNSPVGGVDMFGELPSLWEWVRGASLSALGEFAGEASRITERRFASRPLAGVYYEQVFTEAAAGARVHVHRCRAVDVRDHGSAQAVWLEGSSSPLVVDAVILTQGHVGARPSPASLSLASYADSHGLTYRPPGHASEVSSLQPGESVLLRGMGLTFIDQVTLLTQGRGGKFRRTSAGSLVYEPSGEEPVLYAGSRRGVPYHAKPTSSLIAGPPPLPRFFSRSAAGSDFRGQLWPLVVKEILGGYYHELFLGHPERTTMGWAEFSARFASADDPASLIASAVPDPADRFNFSAEPMAGLEFGSLSALAEWMRGYLQADLRQRSDSRHTAVLGALEGLSSAVMTTLELSGQIDPVSWIADVEQWFLPFASYLSSGPPQRRLAELIALSEAGIVRFLGPQLSVSTRDGCFVAASPAVPGTVGATALIEARLAEPTVETTTDPLVNALFHRGECIADAGTGRLAVRDHRLVTKSGETHPRRFAAGPFVTAVRTSEFGFYAVNDSLARAVLSDDG
ncbi:FAD/NAD(P)-binding protein [Amycolatopsis jejuensis]|uniref:FAD/NAD(P)-binding protein n=1 Tax=Amycolatopsis jejuensis TaxID=330084 RepID=UPI0005256B60|nr:FAD/NAD(P)-binding protein [Amycolatopsis jejuensis]